MPPFGGRKGNTAPAGVQFPVTLGEAEIRDLTSAGDFAQGDAWQRAGHVRNPSGSDSFLHAEVLGAWRRVHPVTVTLVGRDQLRVECGCERGAKGGRLCPHTVALLLHWQRQPASFAEEDMVPTGDDLDDLDDMVDELPERPSPRAEFAALLEADAMNHLRVIARKRGLKIVARNKAEMVEQLTARLSEPESIDAALAGLGEDERRALEAVVLVSVVSRAYSNLISRAYTVLGGTGKIQGGAPVALDTLVDLGLIMPEERQAHPSGSYRVPIVVQQRVEVGAAGPDPLSRLLRQANAVAGAAERRESGHKLGLLDVFQVIVHELAVGAIGAELPLAGKTVAGIPPGWQIDKDATEEIRGKRDPYGRLYRLAPVPSLLAPADLHHVSKLTGQSHRMLDFVLVLLAGLDIVHTTRKGERIRLVAHEESLYRLLTYPRAIRFEVLAEVWLSLPSALDLRTIVGHNRLLQLFFQTSYYTTAYPGVEVGPNSASLRRLLAHLLARAARPDGPWYDVDALLDLLWQLVPDLLGGSASQWWFTDSKRGEARLKLDRREDWLRVWRPLVSGLLSGPLSWLGLVDVATRGDQPVAFRPRPRAAALAGRPVVAEGMPESPLLTIEMDRRAGLPVITVPGGLSDDMDQTLLARTGELVEVSPHELRYRLMPGHVQVLFDDGLQGPELIRDLTEWSGGRLPKDVQATLQQWWEGFGSVRLYDDLALIELSDDILLRELQATTSLDRALIHALSPRVIAVDPALVDDLVAELLRLGHTPRVIEDGS